MLSQLGSRTCLPGSLETITSGSELSLKMWAPITFLWLSSLSLSISENHPPSLKESGARVLQIQKVQSKEQCSQVCGALAGQHFCSLSTEEPRHCIVLDCPLVNVCQEAKPQDVQELVTGHTLEKRNSLSGTDTLFLGAELGISPAPPYNKTIRQTTELARTARPVTVTSSNYTELGTETLNSTEVGISTAPNNSMTTTGRPSALATSQAQRTTEKTSTAVTTALAPSASLPVTHDQINSHTGSQSTPAGITSASATSPTSQARPTHSGIGPTSSSLTPTEGGPVDGPSTPEIPTTTPSPIPLSSTTSAEAFTSTPIISTSTRAEHLTTPESAPLTAQATDPRVTPTAVPTTVAQAAETSGASQTTERASPQTTLSSMSPKVTAESSVFTMPKASVQTVTESQYVWVATSPFTQYLVNKNLLLAMLLAGTIFFIAVLVLLAMQAYESYKKKDYTQVDYLINGMYADSEM
ncbi:LOW QUALITY PROTEIN: uncharacterized protein C11orf24 homolog [Trichosurus vulpecula]|uniref:LOW QUALITY PROTEIN: uncharacterized protein C11orf24 homolog n=1 Tax=Trichosurus vulpecula TaxID=9337 RepID=UPI00186AF888|nr:LOW QUALITY PROTEIN: uncharacterized protein C11orf24 homolog [Trichosurus vulpecula]